MCIYYQNMSSFHANLFLWSHPLFFRKIIIAAKGQIWRIREAIEEPVVQFAKFRHSFNEFMSWCFVLEKNIFSFLYASLFFWFLRYNNPIMLDDALLWLLSFSQDNKKLLYYVYHKKIHCKKTKINP